QRIVAEGHEVGNHSYSHPNLRLLSPANKANEIARTDAILRSLGANPNFVRPPYGSYDAYTVTAAEELGMGIMLWSLDSRDWKSLPANYAVLRSTRGTVYGPGALRGVFLFHDTHKRTVEDLPRIISDLRAGGCQRFVTVSDYLDGLLDPEPGVLMTRRSQPAGQPDGLGPDGLAPAAAARKAEQPAQPKENFQEMPPESYPAGTATLPLARTSRPWQADESAGSEGLQSSAQGDNQASNIDGSQAHQPAGQPPLLRVAPVAPGPNSGLPVGGPVSAPATETAPSGA
ncbi:MAG: polysaccharide deacetylase family protein, partial [Desulfovibrio sp.]|uniref:polysaccharide deacetylase family protein n=1 Tax=Desulfovibrio sp. TaxID=885 RepID=UPI0039E2A915